MASGSRCAPFKVCVFLIFAVSMVVVYATFPVLVNPCTYTLLRVLLAGSGVDPYILSCVASRDDDGAAAGDVKKNVGGPIVTSLLSCREATLPPHALAPLPFYCCPPMSASEPINFTLPDRRAEPLRIRRPVHAVGADEHMAKYERAIALMKALPPTDPRSFYQQANIHCAYCTGSYRQKENQELNVQIHLSWFFFAFHRAYLYFFERIAGKLLGEPGFALPFWSWDVPEGMRMPPEFANSSSPLYDPIRNPAHVPPKVVDLQFGTPFTENNFTDEQQIQQNLRVMYRQMISNAPLPSLFHGQPFRAGQSDKPGAGTVELSPHNTVHTWTGDIAQPNVENMGTYYSAARDPLFYPHHCNIDRLWQLWRHQLGYYHGHVDITDPDWLDSSFLFYDEESRLVRIKVSDVLDIEKLRYTFDDIGMPWADDVQPPPVSPRVNTKQKGSLKSVRFPVFLHSAVTAQVMRTRVQRSRREKELEEEVLLVDGIEYDGADMVKFDVYVNAMEHEKIEPGGREMAGTYVSLSHPSGKGMMIQTTMRVALNELLEDLGTDGDETVTVTLVPRSGKVKIQSLRIAYMVE